MNLKKARALSDQNETMEEAWGLSASSHRAPPAQTEAFRG